MSNFYSWWYDEAKVVLDKKEFKEDWVKRGLAGSGKGGQFVEKPETTIEKDMVDPKHAPGETEGIKSYTTKAEKKNGKWVEVKEDAKGKSTRNDHDSFGKKGKHEKWLKLPPPPEKKPTPALDTFKDVMSLPSKTISGISGNELYKRGEKIEYAKGEDIVGKPIYHWSRGDEELSLDNAARLEKALYEGGYTGALFDGNSDVVVRPDLYNTTGQMASWRTQNGKMMAVYGADALDETIIKKANRVGSLYKVYDQIKNKIIEGVHEDNPYAWLAYFMMRTKVRIGSSSNPTEGRGATDLTKGDVSLSNDGETFYLAFNSKGRQFWHTTAKDKGLYDYLKKRKEGMTGTGSNKTPLFDVSQQKFRDYLKGISQPLTGDPDVYMMPHDFRRLGATRIADEYLRKELQGGESTENRGKWEDRICKAVQQAAAHINDTPKVAFSAYILPEILFSSSPKDLAKYFPCLANRNQPS